ncbi:FAD-dependent monooxygenase [Pikeienuella piscinae]|uniref:FAD-dependent monooxygenase n=1 Tax=Pikeienuella piscinae TaxID=2748098 RepID=A0A7L5BU66_9RHOB|nr:NAD(P)/FAD-dependent oxidoreductase [Pikeienuella piscinae]QIE55295.1 FAD-dependent monooxygenase [Pikeienuella piscinae]
MAKALNILIAGAGPTGLTAALELARRGVIATVIERRKTPSPFSRAVGITTRSLQLLNPSGVADRLIAEGVTVRKARLYRGERRLLTIPFQSETAFFPHILALPQDRTERALADAFRALGGEVRYDLALESAAPDPEGVNVRLTDGVEARFDHLIGADGVHSLTRKAAEVAYHGHDLPGKWAIADVDAEDWPHPTAFTATLGAPGKIAVVVPIGVKRYRVISNTPDALKALAMPLEVTNIRRAAAFTISVRQAGRYSTGRIHLAGDAAHCHSPVGGRGMNLGISDAAELARRLVEGGLDDYSPLREKEGRETIAATERARKLVTAPGPARRALFTTAASLIDRIGPLKRRIGRFAVEA